MGKAGQLHMATLFLDTNSKIKKKSGFNNADREPFIDVRIKPRTKDHPSDDFKLVINYQV